MPRGSIRTTRPDRTRRSGLWALAVLLGALTSGPARAAVVEYTNRREWEQAVKHFSAVRYANEKIEKNVPLDVGLVTIVATGTSSVSISGAEDGTLKLGGSGTTRPWFRQTVKINGGKVCAVGWDWINGGNLGMYKSVLTHDGGTVAKMWPAGKGFLGYVDTQGKTISGFWFGSTGGCNFTSATVENICLSNLQPPPGVDTVAPEWAAFNIHFKDTWAQTLAANPEQQWQKELSDAATLPPALKRYLETNTDAARFVVALRRITLLKALIERFPDDQARRTAAYKTISRTSREIILPWWPDPETSPLGKLKPPARNFELATRWEALLGAVQFHGPEQVLHPADVQGVLDLLDRADARLEISPSHHVSYLVALETLLSGMSSQQLQPLRDAQEKATAYLAEELLRTRDLDEAATLARRAPWAPIVNQRLLELGEWALRQGRTQWALASFQDVLDHAADPNLRQAARAAQWTALAADSGRSNSLAKAMSTVPDDAQMPWRGSTLPAGRLKKMLLAPGSSGPVTLTTLTRKTIVLPQSWPRSGPATDGPRTDFGLHTPRPISAVQPAPNTLLVFAPARAARFNPNASAPLWTHTLVEASTEPPWDTQAAAAFIKNVPKATTFPPRPVTVRSEESSALAQDARGVYCLAAAPKMAVLALDAGTGKPIWSTESRDDWSGLVPMSHPTAADGYVYVLAIPAGLGPSAGQGTAKDAGPEVRWRLVCSDGRDGRVIWTSPLGWQPYTLLDVARGSRGVVVHNGSLYCSTDMGVLARCDARDGAVDWVRGYASATDTDPRAEAFSREGSCLVSGETLLVAPRDHSGVLAVRCDNGQTLWETLAVPSDRLLGVCGKTLLAISHRRLCGLDVDSGRPLWSLNLPQSARCEGTVVGSEAIIISAGRLLRIAAATGQIVETLDLRLPKSSSAVLPGGSVVLEVKPAPPATDLRN